MPSITFNDFAMGLDLRKGPSTSEASRLRVLTNAYVTPGKTIKKRPGLRFIYELEQDCWDGDSGHAGAVMKPSEMPDGWFVTAPTIGLFAGEGVLNTFSAFALTYPDARFVDRLVNNVTIGYTPVSVQYFDTYLGKGYLVYTCENVSVPGDYIVSAKYFDTAYGTNIYPPTYTNVPETVQAVKAGEKMYSVSLDGQSVKYCATNDPKDWVASGDAGYLNTSDRTNGARDATALGIYSNKLVVFSSDSAQIWTVDPDPANMALSEVLDVGTVHPYAHANMGGDLFFLSQKGVRSISMTGSASGNLMENDVGSPVDSLATSLFGGNSPRAIYYRAGGQYWLYHGNQALVYTFSRTSKVSAWSLYEFAVDLEYITELSGELYVRSGYNVYQFADDQYTDNGESIPVSIEFAYLNFKMPGVLKQVLAMDAVISGTASIAHRFDPRDTSLITAAFDLSGDTMPGGLTPVELMTSSIAPVVTHEADEAFELHQLTYYFEPLGIMS